MFIKYCILCYSSSLTHFCSSCYQSLPWNHYCCVYCALPLPKTDSICGQCTTNILPFHNTISLFRYETPIDYLITQFKYQEQLVYGKIFSQLLLTKLITYYEKYPKPEVIIPIPLHRQRLIERGFNQAVELAKPLAKKLSIKLDPHSAKRIRHTAKQSELGLEQRSHNVKNAFTITPQKTTHIAVVDDVITSGHTMEEFCRCLLQAGATKIDVWCVARTNIK